ncbi:hypothetical protein CRE_07810 [Caenorhabditis remanei]|uniref:Uncharacterized protein n=1 Tax=Caenorhabditis remanei TaxID=31234 RepID=E3NEJ1_CAERE|nr:hypothetical protein CRE_07810 [Caenorhabditis remanei]
MHLPILLFLFLGMVASGETEKSAIQIVAHHVMTFVNAVSSKKKDVILQLFNTTADDQKNVDQFIEKFQGLHISFSSAKFNKNGEIESTVRIAEKIPARVNPASPTGWIITQLGGQEPGSAGRKPFSMCHVGLLWCAIESVVEWGKHIHEQ